MQSPFTLNTAHFILALRSGAWSTSKPLFQDSIQQDMARSLLQDTCDLYEVEKNTKEGRLNEYNKDITNWQFINARKLLLTAVDSGNLGSKCQQGWRLKSTSSSQVVPPMCPCMAEGPMNLQHPKRGFLGDPNSYTVTSGVRFQEVNCERM